MGERIEDGKAVAPVASPRGSSGGRVSEKEFRDLRRAAAHRDGVIDARHSGFDRINSQRRLESLAKRGLLEPSPYGDFYITDAGRQVVASSERG